MCGLSLAWVTSENSTSSSNADILSRSSSPWLDPLFSATVSGVRCWLLLSVFPRQLSSADSPLCCPVANCSQLLFSNSLLASRYHFRIRRDFRSKNPLSGFAPKQTKVSSAWRATHIVLHKDCNILTSPTPPDIAVCRSRSPGLLNRRPRGPLRWVLFSLPQLVSNSSDLQVTDFLSTPSYIIVQRPLLLVGVIIALIQPIHGQGYNSDIPRRDAPVIYIGAFPILPGRRSIYNTLPLDGLVS